ncbi:CLUMA_CG006020, isoform A [Clunio marinus]|uniref:CLUMA_CG006020, isoform A n=1 Tax=Clunio marinus TaxID=568069 RepID=A0A1J1HY23_9DIPT|nr:CLUMA_CG006020, isoform A [Clunio marinus]
MREFYKMIRVFGINLSSELISNGNKNLLEYNEILINKQDKIEIFSTAFCELLIRSNILIIKSSLKNNQNKTLDFNDIITKISSTNENCWILLANETLFNYDFIELNLREISIQKEKNQKITSMCASQNGLYYIINKTSLHEIKNDNTQKKLHEFASHQRIKKISCGMEHCVLLTSNGDVFSFGCGLRGALGHYEVNSLKVPKQIEALAGLKVVDIATGSFHSVVLTSFGDVYTWGWNTSGQLGLPKVFQHTFQNISSNQQQVFTTPKFIKMERDETVKNVYCGSKHTILKTEDNRIFAAGLNNFGQLGLSTLSSKKDKFTEIPLKNIDQKTKVVCGYWTTYFIDFPS